MVHDAWKYPPPRTKNSAQVSGLQTGDVAAKAGERKLWRVGATQAIVPPTRAPRLMRPRRDIPIFTSIGSSPSPS